MQGGEAAVLALGGSALAESVEDRLGRGGGALEGGLAHPRVGEQGLEQLAHHPERKLALELGAAGAEHRDAVGGGEPAHRGEQRRLPDPRRPLDQRHASARPADAGDQRVELGHLALALEQPGFRRLLAPSHLLAVGRRAHPRRDLMRRALHFGPLPGLCLPAAARAASSSAWTTSCWSG